MATADTESHLPAVMATKPVLPPIEDSLNTNHRYRGYVYDLRNPRIPITGPVTFRNDFTRKKFPLPASLVKGRPVPAPTPPQGFLMGSEQVRDISAEERMERKINLRLLEKTSAQLRKTEKAQHERESFMREHQKNREDEIRMRAQEKENDLKLLQDYNPFGKPGYGAPRGSGKDNMTITKALRTSYGVGHVEVNPGTALEPVKAELPPSYVKPRVRRYEDDRMRRYGVDQETATQYRKELDAHQEIRKRDAERIKDIDSQREKQALRYDPFGKPGAGAPNRDKEGKFQLRRSVSLSYTNNPDDAKRAILIHKTGGNVKAGRKFLPKETKITAESQGVYDPWGKDNRRKDKDGNVIKLPRTGDHGIYEFVDPNVPNHSFPRKHLGGGGEPLLMKNGDVQTKRPGLLTTIHGARRTENITKVATPESVRRQENKSPWGKPGAGAPLTDSDGNIVKNTKGRINREALGLSTSEAAKVLKAKNIYRAELKEGITMQNELREQEKSYQREPPGDVPSWFSKGQVGRPRRDPETGLIVPQKRIMSDVTAQKLDKNRPKNTEGYYKELGEIAYERKRKRAEEKERIAKLDAKHFNAFASNFEKPGNGAPTNKGNARKKFSTSAFQAQPQKGTQVLPSHHKTTLFSAINLPKSDPLIGDPAQFETEYDHYNVCCAEPVKNKRMEKIKTDELIHGSLSESHLGNTKSVFTSKKSPSICPVKVIYESKSLADKVSATYKATKHYVTPTPSQTLVTSINDPFPYRVVAPWAIDS